MKTEKDEQQARWVRSVADCHSSYREPHCTAPGIPSAPAFCGGYGTDLAGVYLYNVILLLCFVPYVYFLLYIPTPHKGQCGRLPFFLPRTALPAPQSRPNASVLGGLRSGGARTRWPFARHWAIAQMGGVKTASREGLRSRIRAPREMAVCHAFGQGGDARWPFARHPASEMAVCQAPGQRDGRLPGIRPALRAAARPTLAKFLGGRRPLI